MAGTATAAPLDPVQELERLEEAISRRRRLVIGMTAGFLFIFALALVQFLGTLSAFRLLQEARREADRVHRETDAYLEEIHGIEASLPALPRRPEPPAPESPPAAPAVNAVRDATGNPEQMKRDVPHAGALLVGFRAGLRQQNGVHHVASLQPIYLTAEGETLGQRRGEEPPLVIHYRARKGYAVGAIRVRSNARIDLQLTYMRIGAKYLDPADSYTDEWMGSLDTTNELVLGGDGSPVLGWLSSGSADGDLTEVGLVRIQLSKVADAGGLPEPEDQLAAILGEIRRAIQENRLTPKTPPPQ